MDEERIREILQGEQSRPKVQYVSPSKLTSDDVVEICTLALNKIDAAAVYEENNLLNRTVVKMAQQLFVEKSQDTLSVVKGLEMAISVLPKAGKYNYRIKTLIEDVKSGKVVC